MKQALPGDIAPRVLIGHGQGGAEARLLVSAGPLRGLEIRLQDQGAGISATLSPSAATSTGALIQAVSEVTRRLEGKGITFVASVAPRGRGRAESGGASEHRAPRDRRG